MIGLTNDLYNNVLISNWVHLFKELLWKPLFGYCPISGRFKDWIYLPSFFGLLFCHY